MNILIKRLQRQVYEWRSVITSVIFGVMMTLTLSYLYIILMIVCLMIYRSPEWCMQQMLYPDGQCSQEDITELNEFLEKFQIRIWRIQLFCEKGFDQRIISTVLFYLSILAILNWYFGTQKVVILFFWIHLFYHHHLGDKVCQIFHDAFFSPMYSKIFTKTIDPKGQENSSQNNSQDNNTIQQVKGMQNKKSDLKN